MLYTGSLPGKRSAAEELEGHGFVEVNTLHKSVSILHGFVACFGCLDPLFNGGNFITLIFRHVH